MGKVRITESELKSLVRRVLKEEMERVDSPYLQDTIEVILDDWSQELSDDEKRALEFLKARLNQSYPSGDVTRSNLEDLMQQFLRRRDPDLRISDLMELVDIIMQK